MKLTKKDYSFLSDYLIDTPEVKEKTVFDTIKTVSFDVRNKIMTNPIEFHGKLELNTEVSCEYSLKKLAIASIVLSEGDGEYEEELRRSDKYGKLEMYYAQLWRGISKIVKIKEFIGDKIDNIWNQDISTLYSELSLLIFQTDNLNEINKNFSKDERIKYRIFMIKFLDNLEKLKIQKNKIKNGNDLILVLNSLRDFKIDDNEEVDFEFLPYGMVVYLEENTFNNYLGSGETKGLEINGEILGLMCKETINFKDFGGTILFIKGDKTKKSTFDHENTHLIYDKFFRTLLDFENEQLIGIYGYENFYLSHKKDDIDLSYTDFLNKTLKSLSEVSIELAKDEANAYYKEGRRLFLLSNYGYESFASILDEIIIELKEFEKANNREYPEYRERIKNMKNKYLEEIGLYAYIINFFEDFENFPSEICNNKDNLRLMYQFFIEKGNKQMVQTFGVQFQSFKNNYEDFNSNNLETIQNFIDYGSELDDLLLNGENEDNLINAINIGSFHYQDEYFYLIIEMLKLTNNTNLEETLLLYINEYFCIFSHNKNKIIKFQEELYSIQDKYGEYKYNYIEKVDEILNEEDNTLL